MSKHHFQKYPVIPLDEDNFKRITEINFRVLVEHLIEVFDSPRALEMFLDLTANNLALSSDLVNSLMRRSFRDRSLPPSKQETIELMYRGGFSRRDIAKAVKCHDRTITKVIASDISSIVPPKLIQSEYDTVLKIVNLFTVPAERMI